VVILSLNEDPAASPKVASHQPDALIQANAQAAYGRLPLAFEVNQGQVDKEVKFLSRGSGYSLSLTSTGAVLQFVIPKKRMPISASKSSGQPLKITNRHWSTLHFKLVGASSAPQIDGLDPLPGKSNYLTTNDLAKWRTNIPNYSKVRYKDVYPGIDLIYYGNQRDLEYDFVVAPGADPKVVTLSFEGIVDSRSVALRIDNNGDLVLDAVDLRQHKPVVYQELDGIRESISCRYVLKGGQRVGFELGAYDRSRPLVIDPVLSYSTTGLGGSAIAVDSLGNAYLTGDPGFQGVLGSSCGTAPNTFPCYDAFVAKLNASGTELIYSTYFGGNDVDYGTAIAVDHAGNAYLAGVTSSANFPTTPDAFQTTGGGAGVLVPSYDVFVAKLIQQARPLFTPPTSAAARMSSPRASRWIRRAMRT
jgi:Beta-propeller repeat